MTRYPFFRVALIALLAGLGAFLAVFRPGWTGPEVTPSEGGIRPAAVFESLENDRFLAGLVGVSAAVRSGDGDVVTYTSGTTAGVGSPALDASTAFEAASLSKPVTAYAVLRLAEAGRLDLDAVHSRGGYSFTLRQVLQHSGGFNNSLGSDPAPASEPGPFRYAGAGYLYLSEIIEETTGESFASYMNGTVLPELGMADSSFGPAPGRPELARPAIDAGIPVGLAILAAALVLTPLALIGGVLSWALRLERGWLATGWLGLTLALTAAGGVAAPLYLFGTSNALVMAGAAALAIGLLLVAGIVWFGSRGLGQIWTLVPLGLVVAAAALRPPLVIEERPAVFLAPAGLRTTPADYVVFLETLMAADSPQIRAMIEDTVPVTDHSRWGLGIGVTTGAPAAIWHWGVNFPGYQAFAVAWPESGEAAVILTSGGQMSFTPSGFRYSGLEASLDALAAGGAPVEGSWWEGIQ